MSTFHGQLLPPCDLPSSAARRGAPLRRSSSTSARGCSRPAQVPARATRRATAARTGAPRADPRAARGGGPAARGRRARHGAARPRLGEATRSAKRSPRSTAAASAEHAGVDAAELERACARSARACSAPSPGRATAYGHYAPTRSPRRCCRCAATSYPDFPVADLAQVRRGRVAPLGGRVRRRARRRRRSDPRARRRPRRADAPRDPRQRAVRPGLRIVAPVREYDAVGADL